MVAAPAKLSDADVKRIRRRIGKGEYQTALAEEFGLNRKTIRRRLDALERAEEERAETRLRRQVAREKRKFFARERAREAALAGKSAQVRRRARAPSSDPYLRWLDRPKNLSGRALFEASGLVRVRRPDYSVRKAVERGQVEDLLDLGWILDDTYWSKSRRSR
jgi:hypothetical protein